MTNLSHQFALVTTAVALTSATVAVLPAAAEQIINQEFSGELELSDFPDFLPEPPPETRDYEGFVEYNTEGELLSWFLDVEGLEQVGSDITLEPLPSPFPSPLPVPPRNFITTFDATPDSWILDIDFGRAVDAGAYTLTWNRDSGITFTLGGSLLPPTVYVDPNPNFSETITEDPSKPDPTSVPEPASGLALLGLSALGAGSLLKRREQ
ncbi:MAG: PEP-CTERM sorting domain-containing protein [Moorea sp. SIO1G6]|uniref:PEP-CTERM sorting domain-containing protein n=1 Tax=Moorena sp. SIO1G6 TaxID=2607840 RepID=UPI0013BF753E|nr:PEP-CTERM sorting domain-containing protein [Moorena sp. SIO1G6]NET64762.1 PEP-CTERM sorting domain-containing protein [Moorena sp. SIO1G6]